MDLMDHSWPLFTVYACSRSDRWCAMKPKCEAWRSGGSEENGRREPCVRATRSILDAPAAAV